MRYPYLFLVLLSNISGILAQSQNQTSAANNVTSPGPFDTFIQVLHSAGLSTLADVALNISQTPLGDQLLAYLNSTDPGYIMVLGPTEAACKFS